VGILLDKLALRQVCHIREGWCLSTRWWRYLDL